MSFDFVAVADAARGWVKAALGLDDAHVILANQQAPWPSMPFADVDVRTPRMHGVSDELTYDYDGARPAGEEIHVTASGQREVTIGISVRTEPTIGGSQARALAARIQTAAALPSNTLRFEAAGLGLFDLGAVTGVPEVRRTAYEGRALFEARFYCGDDATEAEGYIDSVEITDRVSPLPDRTFTVP